jgi:hypothetical protein
MDENVVGDGSAAAVGLLVWDCGSVEENALGKGAYPQLVSSRKVTR